MSLGTKFNKQDNGEYSESIPSALSSTKTKSLFIFVQCTTHVCVCMNIMYVLMLQNMHEGCLLPQPIGSKPETQKTTGDQRKY